MNRLKSFRIAALLAAALLAFVGCEEVGQTNQNEEPYLTLETKSLNLGSEEGTISFALASNLSWRITTPAEWLSIIPTSGAGNTTVRCQYKANTTGRDRSNKIEVSASQEGFVSVNTILVFQSSSSTGGSDNGDDSGDDVPEGVIKATVAEFLAAEPSTTQWYQLTGEVVHLDNATYGNFNLDDGTGDVFIYGLCSSKLTSNDKSFPSLGIKEGDIVTLQTLRSNYKGDPQGGGANSPAVYISHTSGGSTGGDDNGDDNLVENGGTPHAGWAELPAEQDNSDYYYAYHMRSDYNSQRNFSVCYSAEMGCPVWVAAPIHKCYCGSGRNESYAPDPVIPSGVQKNADKAGDTNKGNWMNRGHMLASNMRNVTAATNIQVFYYSNIAPQDGDGFNTGDGWWNELEDLEKSRYMCADTLYTVNGCHWTNKNETFGDRVVPTHFYKVFLRTKKGNSGKWVINCSESELQCVAFYAPHYHGAGGKTEPSSSHMMSVAELEEITGHTFFPNVPNAPKDTFNPSDWGM